MIKNDEEENIIYQRDQESELFPINNNNNNNINKKTKKKYMKKDNFIYYFWIFIICFSLIYLLIDFIANKKPIKVLTNKNKKESIENKPNELKYRRKIDEKIGVAFVFISLFGNGIGRMLSLLSNELIKMDDKYDIYLITNPPGDNDFYLDKRIIRLPIYGNRTLIEEFDKTSNILYYVISNVLSITEINFYKSLNKKVIKIEHGAYLSSVYTNITGVYREWHKNSLFDAFIQVVPDDYYVYKKLGLNNTFLI